MLKNWLVTTMVLYKVSEVAKLLKVNRNFVYNLIKTGQLKAVNVGTIKVKHDDLMAYIDGCQI